MNKPQGINQLETISSLKELISLKISEDHQVHSIFVQNETLLDFNFDHCEFKRVVFENCVLNHCNFEKCSFVDVVFNHCDISNSNYKQSYFERCEFTQCKGMGMDYSKSNLKHVNFEQSNLQYTFLSILK